jgi:hypothetical protein
LTAVTFFTGAKRGEKRRGKRMGQTSPPQIHKLNHLAMALHNIAEQFFCIQSKGTIF